MSAFYISKEQLWCEAADTAETLKYRLESLERGEDKLKPGERKTVAAMKRKLVNFMMYGQCRRQRLQDERRLKSVGAKQTTQQQGVKR